MSKYETGKVIESLDELYKQELIFFTANGFKKVYHRGWFGGWQIRYAHDQIMQKRLYTVKTIENKW